MLTHNASGLNCSCTANSGQSYTETLYRGTDSGRPHRDAELIECFRNSFTFLNFTLHLEMITLLYQQVSFGFVRIGRLS